MYMARNCCNSPHNICSIESLVFIGAVLFLTFSQFTTECSTDGVLLLVFWICTSTRSFGVPFCSKYQWAKLSSKEHTVLCTCIQLLYWGMAIVPFIINELTITSPSTARDIQPILSHKTTRLLAGQSTIWFLVGPRDFWLLKNFQTASW
jgi:hypothetical protein